MIIETINQRIAHLRKNRGYTQKELASLLDINYNTYSQLERKGDIRSQTILELSKIFDVSVQYLLTGMEPAPALPKPPEEPVELIIPPLTKQEENLIKILRNGSKEDQEAVYDLLEQIYQKSLKKKK